MRRLAPYLRTLTLLAGIAWMAGCQDLPPNDYIPRYVVQGFLITNHGVDSIFVRRSLPVSDAYDPANAGVRHAQVTITVDGVVHTLMEKDTPAGFYYLPKSELTILSNKTYYLEIHAGADVIKASTLVPDSIRFTTRPPDTLQYPSDPNEQNTPAGFAQWTDRPGRVSYAANVACLDTLWYQSTTRDTTINGRDTTITTGIPNKRIDRFWEANAPFYKDVSRWAPFIDQASVPLPWTGFKWYGRQRITVYAIDQNFYDWLRVQFFGTTYKPQLNHIEGGIGVFGAAGMDTTLVFVKR